MGIYRGWIISVTRRINWVAGKRADLSDMRSIESAVSYDFDSLATTILTGESKSYIVRGFELSMSSAIGSPASGLQLLVSNSSFLHGSSAVSGTFFSIPTGTNPELLDSNVNTKVIGSFVTNTVNYIGIEFNRSIDPATSGQTYLWNPATKTEISKTLPLAETLSYNIIITSSSWAANVLPIATVTTNVNNNVISVTDNRPMYMRLGTAGFNTPNPIYSYPWNNQTEGRVENSYISSTNNVSPFRGGDKQILNMKEWMDAIMTSVKEIKGTTYWYQPASVGSLTKLREDTTNTVITGTGNISHDPSVAGKANWSSDVILNFLGGNLKYTIAANPTSSYVTLADNQVAYIKLVRDVVIPNNLIFTNGSNIVTSVDLLANWTSNLVAGDFIKLTVADDTKYYHIASVNTISQVTLTLAYAESTSPTIGDVASYAWGSYQAVATPTTDRHIKIVNKSALPFNQDTYWLFFRCDDASIIPKLYARFTQTELTQGESINISNTTSNQVLEFIGSPSDATSTPTYSLIAAGAITGSANYNTIGGQNLTERSAYLTSMMQNKAQDKTIKYADNYITVNNLTSGSNQLITFIGSGTPTTNVILPSVSNFNNTITLTGTLTLAVNQAAYFVVDRNAGFSVSTLSSLIVTSISSVPLNENTFIFAYRLSAVDCYLYNGKHLNLGGNPMNSAGGLIKARVRNNTSTTLPTGAVVIDGITILDQDTVLFTNLSSGNNEIYTATVVAGSVTTWNAQYDFSGYTTPTIGDLVNISEGTVFGGSIARYDGSIFEIDLKRRAFNGNDYYEESALLSSIITNNTVSPAVITSYNYAGSEYSIIEYSISRGTARETGAIKLATDGTSVAISNDAGSLSPTGVVLSADISGSLLRVLYTSDNIGSAGVMKFSVKRWSNSAGGPAGLPSYTGGGGGGGGSGTVTSSGLPTNGDIAIFTGTTDITSNSNFRIDTADGSLNLNGLHIGVLSAPFTLVDNQTSPAVVTTFDITLFPFVVMEYSVLRNGERRVGRIMLTNNGSSANISDDFSPTADVGTTFTTDVSGSVMRLLYTSTSTGFSGTMKFSTRKWA